MDVDLEFHSVGYDSELCSEWDRSEAVPKPTPIPNSEFRIPNSFKLPPLV